MSDAGSVSVWLPFTVLTSVFALTRNGQVISGKRFYAKTPRRQDAKEDKKASKNTFALWHTCDI